MKFEYLGEEYQTPLKCKNNGMFDANGKQFLAGYKLDEEIERLIVRAVNLAFHYKQNWLFKILGIRSV